MTATLDPTTFPPALAAFTKAASRAREDVQVWHDHKNDHYLAATGTMLVLVHVDDVTAIPLSQISRLQLAPPATTVVIDHVNGELRDRLRFSPDAGQTCQAGAYHGSLAERADKDLTVEVLMTLVSLISDQHRSSRR